MKILLVNDFGYPQEGGAEVYFFNIKNELAKRGHSVVTVSSNFEKDNIPLATDFQILRSGHCFNLDSFFNVINFLQLRKILNRFKPDIVHLNNIFYTLSPSILFAVNNYKTVMTLHDYYIICAKYKVMPDRSVCRNNFGSVCREKGCASKKLFFEEMIKRGIIRKGLKNVDLFISPSEYLKKEFERNGIKNIAVLPNSHGLRAEKCGYQYSDSSDILYLGRLAEQKGVEHLLRAIAIVVKRHPEIALQVAGDGEQKEYLKSLTLRLGVEKKVIFLGKIKEDRKDSVIKGSLFLVVPSVWPEVSSLVTFEAACFGKAVIASNIGAIPEFIKDNETGFLVPSGDPGALAEKIIYALENKSALGRIGENLVRISKAYGLDEYVARLEDIYKKI